MCGIIGYAGGGNAAENVYEGLKRLEYRGYDSAGMAVIAPSGEVKVIKKQGKVSVLEPYIADIRGAVGMGHTRWATHGKPSDINAHPHSAGGIYVVHNGIIENYAELKEKLIAAGETFISETDSEVIAHLIKLNCDGNILTALHKTAKMLTGSYALMVMREGEHKIAVLKYRSSLIVGYGEGENFCASDRPALAGKCDKISVLEDGDFALISAEKIEIFDKDLTPVCRPKTENALTAEKLGLNGCPHYMLKELREVPQTVQNTFNSFNEVKDELSEVLSGTKRVIFLGCGTAYHAGLIGKKYFETFARIPAEAENASEFRYKDPVISRGDAVFAVTQSGETADTIEAALLAKSLGAKVIAVTNVPQSAITRCVHAVVPVAAGAEICVAATKSYVGQIAALYLCALTFAGKAVTPKEFKLLSELPAALQKTINNINVYTLAHMCARSGGVYFLGRGYDYAVALEGSLKLKEVSYVPSEGYPAGELKHGTLALIDENTVSVVLITDSALAPKSENAVEQVLSRGGKVAVITCLPAVAKRLEGKAEIILLPACNKFLSPLVSAIAVQELAYRTAVILGRDPDKPRNLAKSVTVE
ncbi:MAG: glutamine--fructose-6-phosphate transaminase (isomerizing) [Clostridia bacterium]|nr:glutamine--fructose-6-phosphate transaminase (isomerizing) [Clostridia bacterium]